jgi:hypothetical protein
LELFWEAKPKKGRPFHSTNPIIQSAQPISGFPGQTRQYFPGAVGIADYSAKNTMARKHAVSRDLALGILDGCLPGK